MSQSLKFFTKPHSDTKIEETICYAPPNLFLPKNRDLWPWTDTEFTMQDLIEITNNVSKKDLVGYGKCDFYSYSVTSIMVVLRCCPNLKVYYRLED